jgi:hypothetical protein
MSEEQNTVDQKKEANKELQGKKATTKKKVRAYTHAEAVAEMARLERAGHQSSKYYKDVKKRMEATAGKAPVSAA